MKIDTTQSRTASRRPKTKVGAILLLACGVIAVLALAFFAGVVFSSSSAKERLDKILDLDPGEVAANFVTSWGAAPVELTIDVKHEHYSRLAEARNLALERNQITSDLKQYVPAKIRFRDETLKAEIRLKGEWVDHVDTDKWSFRVKVKGDDAILGMKRFSLQHPKTRSYHNELFYQLAMRKQGIVSLRYQFVRVTLNGRDQGVYALEEHFGKQLVESNQRREGIVVRFDSNLRYKPFSLDIGARSVKVPGVLRSTVKQGIGTQQASDVIAYDQDKVSADEKLREQFNVAYNLLQALRDQRLPTHKVFDIEKLASYSQFLS